MEACQDEKNIHLPSGSLPVPSFDSASGCHHTIGVTYQSSLEGARGWKLSYSNLISYKSDRHVIGTSLIRILLTAIRPDETVNNLLRSKNAYS